jgi:hypothetical protein
MARCCQKLSTYFQIPRPRFPHDLIGLKLTGRGKSTVERYYAEEDAWGVEGDAKARLSWNELVFLLDKKVLLDLAPDATEYQVYTQPREDASSKEVVPFTVCWEVDKGWGVRANKYFPARNEASLFRTFVSENKLKSCITEDDRKERVGIQRGNECIDNEAFRKKFGKELGAPLFVNKPTGTKKPNARIVWNPSDKTLGITKRKGVAIKEGDFLSVSYGGSAGSRLETALAASKLYYAAWRDGGSGIYAAKELEEGANLGVYSDEGWRDDRLSRFLRKGGATANADVNASVDEGGNLVTTRTVEADAEIVVLE